MDFFKICRNSKTFLKLKKFHVFIKRKFSLISTSLKQIFCYFASLNIAKFWRKKFFKQNKWNRNKKEINVSPFYQHSIANIPIQEHSRRKCTQKIQIIARVMKSEMFSSKKANKKQFLCPSNVQTMFGAVHTQKLAISHCISLFLFINMLMKWICLAAWKGVDFCKQFCIFLSCSFLKW